MTTAVQPPKRWFRSLKAHPRPQLRLLCFPFAGTGASAFRSWSARLPEPVELWAVQLPGREARFNEPSHTRMAPLIDELVTALEPSLDVPCAFFGHSMGALVAFETARELRRRGLPLPVHLTVSGHRAPGLPHLIGDMHKLPDAQFAARVRELEGLPEEVLQMPELAELVFQTLRSDCELLETYAFRPEPPLPLPLWVLGGESDPDTGQAQLDAWEEQSTRFFGVKIFPGGHFFIRSEEESVLELLGRQLRALIGP